MHRIQYIMTAQCTNTTIICMFTIFCAQKFRDLRDFGQIKYSAQESCLFSREYLEISKFITIIQYIYEGKSSIITLRN